MATLLTKKSDTASSVPLTADLTNAAGGAELAVNTADKRLFTKTSGGTVVELGTSPSALTLPSATSLPSGAANGVTYLNGSKVLTTGSALTFDGTALRSSTYLGLSTNTTPNTSTGEAIFYKASAGATLSGFNLVFETGSAGSRSEQMRLTSTGLGIGTSSPTATGNYRVTEIKSANATSGGMLILSTSDDSGVARLYNTSTQIILDDSGSTSDIFIKTNSSNPLLFGISNTEQMRLTSTGLGIGTSSPSVSAILDAQSTTKGVRMPNMTTTQKNAIASPAAGLMVFDTTLAKLCVYTGAAWQTITSA